MSKCLNGTGRDKTSCESDGGYFCPDVVLDGDVSRYVNCLETGNVTEAVFAVVAVGVLVSILMVGFKLTRRLITAAGER